MPAIRFRYNGILAIATAPPEDNHWVEIRMHNGKLERFEFLGLVCKAGINLMPDGAYAKMMAVEVSNGDGRTYGEWRSVEQNQVVLGWRVLHKAHGHSSWGVYGVVDNQGWPIVLEDRNYKVPEIKKATLYHLRKPMPAKKPEETEKSRA